MSRISHRCESIDVLHSHNTQIELLKQSDITQTKDIDDIKSTLKTNTVIMITNLFAIILCLIGIIAMLFEKL